MMYDRIPTRVSISMSLIEELKMEFAGRIVGAQAGLAVAGAAYYFATRSKEKYTPADEITADTVLSAASSIVKACRSYGFVCTRSLHERAPECRVMDLHRLAGNTMEFGLVSRSFTRKAESLRNCEDCSIAFHDPRASGEAGYLVLYGSARELSDSQERSAIWKPSWSLFHPGPHEPQVAQWHFVPSRLEMVGNLHGVTDDWTPVKAVRDPKRAEAPWVLQQRRAERVAREAEKRRTAS